MLRKLLITGVAIAVVALIASSTATPVVPPPSTVLSATVVPIDRIQSVDTIAGPIQRLFGITGLRVQTAGGGKDAVQDIADADLKWFPVEGVSWNDAQDFIKLLNEKTNEPGWVYRLPREAEWESACRGGASSQPFHLGNGLSSSQANIDGKCGSCPFARSVASTAGNG